MKGAQRRGLVRQYRKSELPRFRWTPELHEHFVEAVERLGGKYRATPKRILQAMMSVKGLRISHIKSHLQMHRNVKYEDNIDALVAMKHLQTNRAQHSDDDVKILSVCSSGRPLRDDFRNPESKRQILVDASKGIQLAKDDDADDTEDSGTSFLARMSNGEDNNDEEMNEICELSLSLFTTAPSLTRNAEVQGLQLPLAGGRDRRFSSRNTVIHIPEFHSFGSNNINLDLTI